MSKMEARAGKSSVQGETVKMTLILDVNYIAVKSRRNELILGGESAWSLYCIDITLFRLCLLFDTVIHVPSDATFP